MAGHWSRLECELIVEDYLEMLATECQQEPYNKAEHNRDLQAKLNGRSRPSIEFKHRNISAALLRAGHVYIRGYKPAWNYQELLETVVLDRITADERTLQTIETSLIGQLGSEISVDDTKSIVVPPPERLPGKSVRDKPQRKPRKIDYAARESRNRHLGALGEEFVVNFERKRLAEVGREDLINDVEWTSKERGDGTGYDIRSFQDATDEPFYIEVKTTNSGKYQPFMISRGEVSFSDEFADQFSLYRVFEFSRQPFMFILEGPVAAHVDLSATTFRASFQ